MEGIGVYILTGCLSQNSHHNYLLCQCSDGERVGLVKVGIQMHHEIRYWWLLIK